MSKRINLRRAKARAQSQGVDPVERVAALTRTARANWLGLLSYLAFVGVTLLGVEDADFFITERETALPLIGVTIPTNLFFYIAPGLGAMLYIHMHLYLLKLWKALGELPDNGGRPAGEEIAPWVVSDMALAGRPGAVHRYPLRSLANIVVFLSIFVAAPAVLAGFWWRSMPKHDELLTIVFCGVPLFLSVLAGVESWLALHRNSDVRHTRPWEKAVWAIGLIGMSAFGFLTTKGGVTDAFLQSANLSGVVFVETPPDWRSREEAEQIYRKQWCDEQGIAQFACGPGPLARDAAGDPLQSPVHLGYQRDIWCRKVMGPGSGQEQCERRFKALGEAYKSAWRVYRDDAVRRLPVRDFSRYDLRGANLWQARLVGADLRSVALDGAFLLGARLEGADLKGARLAEAFLREALMEGASLFGAELEGADLRGARLEGADLRDARLEGADLKDARLEGADLREARLEGADLWGARLEGADLREARLEGANLQWARLEGADLRDARLEGADFRDARLEGADLSGALMEGANLERALLEGAVVKAARLDENTSFHRAILRGALWKEVNLARIALDAEQIKSSFGDASVTLPDGIDRPAHWPDWSLPDYGSSRDVYDEWRKWQADPDTYTPPPRP